MPYQRLVVLNMDDYTCTVFDTIDQVSQYTHLPKDNIRDLLNRDLTSIRNSYEWSILRAKSGDELNHVLSNLVSIASHEPKNLATEIQSIQTYLRGTTTVTSKTSKTSSDSKTPKTPKTSSDSKTPKTSKTSSDSKTPKTSKTSSDSKTPKVSKASKSPKTTKKPDLEVSESSRICKYMKDDGTRCKSYRQGNEKFCHAHNSRRCKYTKDDGTRCKSYRQGNEKFCYAHSAKIEKNKVR
jgi:hypothetical protein